MNIYKTIRRACNNLVMQLYPLVSKRKMIDLADLFDTPTMTKYHHTLVALRYAAVEEHYGENDFGRQLYITANRWENDAALQADLERFDALIQSIETNGYNNKSVIYVDMDGNCFNGTHRLALCIWFGIGKIPAYLVKRHLKVPTVEEMKDHYRMSDEGYGQLEEVYHRMYARLHNK